MYVMPKNWKIWIAIKIIRIITTKFSLSQLLKFWLGMRTHTEFLLSFFLKLNSLFFNFQIKGKPGKWYKMHDYWKRAKYRRCYLDQRWSWRCIDKYRKTETGILETHDVCNGATSSCFLIILVSFMGPWSRD